MLKCLISTLQGGTIPTWRLARPLYTISSFARFVSSFSPIYERMCLTAKSVGATSCFLSVKYMKFSKGFISLCLSIEF